MDLNDYLAAPEIVRRLTSQDAFENETVTFTCTVQNADTADDDESYSISWFFNDKQIESNNEKYSIDENAKTGICLLTIRHITLDDEGAYRCVATNKYGSSITTGFLAVLSKFRLNFYDRKSIEFVFFSERKRSQSQSPSPTRNASPNRSLSPSNNRARDRSVSPLRYINLPVSKLARVTEELESLIHPTAPIVHEENEEEEEDTSAVVPQAESMKIIVVEPDEVATTLEKQQHDISTPIESIETETSIVLPQIPTPVTTTTTTTTEATVEDDNKMETITIPVSYYFVVNQYFLFIY